MESKVDKTDVKVELKLAGLPIGFFIPVAIVVIGAIYLNKLPAGMIGAFAAMIVIGAILGLIGEKTPIVKDYLGGAPVVVIFGTAALVYFQALPEKTIEIIDVFMTSGGFLNFYIAALITGSILGMDSKLLVKAGARYAVPLVAGVIGSFVLAAVVAGVIGYGWKDGILNIAMPIMGGGMGAGAVPMSQIYSQFLNRDATQVLSVLVPALALGNMLSIVSAGLLDKLGQARPSLSGNGRLMKGFDYKVEKEQSPTIQLMGVGLLVSVAFYTLGVLLNIVIKPIHSYALMIISVAVCKIAGVVPEPVQRGANQWYKFIAQNLTLALLVGIGISYTSLADIIAAISIQYIILVVVVVIGAILGAGIVGRFVGFYFIESAITAGLCMANMGGTGDVAVLSAANRMELMPFAQISSRLGGALILIIASFLAPLFA
jgi:malate:Na+ symporter